MKRGRSEYERIHEVAKQLLSPACVKRECGGDNSLAEKTLAEEHGFDGRETYMRYLCHLLAAHPDEMGFSAAVKDFKENGAREFVARFVDFEIDVGPELRVGTTPDMAYIGDCFEQALNYVAEHVNDKAILVLGHVTDEYQITPINHAWVELPGDIVFDGVTQRFYRQKDYYARRGAVKKKECEFMEADLMLSRQHIVSPWED